MGREYPEPRALGYEQQILRQGLEIVPRHPRPCDNDQMVGPVEPEEVRALVDAAEIAPAPSVKGTHGDLGPVFKALSFAARKHCAQRRKNREASPYINHPIDLANILVNEAQVTDTEVLVAAVLHDTIEDTDTTREEILQCFGAEVAAVVAEVTDDRTLPRAERKRLQETHAPILSHRAQQVKLADKISNLRDLATSPPITWSLERMRDYFDWAKRVIDGMRGRHPRLEALFDEAHRARP